MTTHSLVFDLRPIAKIVSVIESESEPRLDELAKAINKKATSLLGSIPAENVVPLSEADSIGLYALVNIPAEQVVDVRMRVCLNLMDFVAVVAEYFSTLRTMREFTNEEQAVRMSVQQLLNDVRNHVRQNMSDSSDD